MDCKPSSPSDNRHCVADSIQKYSTDLHLGGTQKSGASQTAVYGGVSVRGASGNVVEMAVTREGDDAASACQRGTIATNAMAGIKARESVSRNCIVPINSVSEVQKSRSRVERKLSGLEIDCTTKYVADVHGSSGSAECDSSCDAARERNSSSSSRINLKSLHRRFQDATVKSGVPVNRLYRQRAQTTCLPVVSLVSCESPIPRLNPVQILPTVSESGTGAGGRSSGSQQPRDEHARTASSRLSTAMATIRDAADSVKPVLVKRRVHELPKGGLLRPIMKGANTLDASSYQRKFSDSAEERQTAGTGTARGSSLCKSDQDLHDCDARSKSGRRSTRRKHAPALAEVPFDDRRRSDDEDRSSDNRRPFGDRFRDNSGRGSVHSLYEERRRSRGFGGGDRHDNVRGENSYDDEDDYCEDDRDRFRYRSVSRASERYDQRHREDFDEQRYRRDGRPKSAQPYDNHSYSDDDDDRGDDLPFERSKTIRRRHRISRNQPQDPRLNLLLQDPEWGHFLHQYFNLYGYFPSYASLKYWSSFQRQQRTVTNSYPTTLQAQVVSPQSTAVSNPLAECALPRTASVLVTEKQKFREPLKYAQPHFIAKFGPTGYIATLMVNRRTGALPSAVAIRSLSFLITDPGIEDEITLLESFPGPLNSSDSPKELILQYCVKQSERVKKQRSDLDFESQLLMWQLLILLIRQNGICSGSDLAQLLLEYYKPNYYACDSDDDVDTVSGRFPHGCRRGSGGSVSTDFESDFVIPPQQNSRDGQTPLSKTSCHTQTTNQAEQQFIELLLRGYQKDALEYAMKMQLWGHALFLAMKMGPRVHTSVMTRFANSVAINSPLQTLYQMLSGGVPHSTTRSPDDQWGDWKPHVAMILANMTAESVDPALRERQLYALMAMGHTLMNSGDVFAAQFCYLSCHVLGRWDVFHSANGQNALVTLVGAHRDATEHVFTIGRYHMTELYEYAVGLKFVQDNQNMFCIPGLQNYKLLYAVKLAEYGFAEVVEKYATHMAKCLHTAASCQYEFPDSLVAAVFQLAARFQKFDPSDSFSSLDWNKWLCDMQSNRKQLDACKDQTAVPDSTAFVYSNPAIESNALQSRQSVSDHGQIQNVDVSQSTTSSVGQGQGVCVEAAEEVVASSAGGDDDGSEPAFRSLYGKAESLMVRNRVDSASYNAGCAAGTFAIGGFANAEAQVAPSSSNIQYQTTSIKHSSASLTYYSPGNANFFADDSSVNVADASSYHGATGNQITDAGRLPSMQPAHFSQSPSNNQKSFTEDMKTSENARLDSSKRSQSWIGKTMGGFIQKFMKGPNEMILPDDSTKTIVWDDERKRWVNLNEKDAEDEQLAPPPHTSYSSSSNVNSLQAAQNSYLSGNIGDAEERRAEQSSAQLLSKCGVSRVTRSPCTRRYVDLMSPTDASSPETPTSALLPPVPLQSGPSSKGSYWVPSAPVDTLDDNSPFSVPTSQPDRMRTESQASYTKGETISSTRKHTVMNDYDNVVF